jgi:hypothetical protein
MTDRESAQVQVAATPQSQTGMAEGLSSLNVGRRWSQAARRRGGRYGLLSSLTLALGNSSTAYPTLVGHDNASGRAGGRRRRSSQTPRCHDGDRVKVCQAWCPAPPEHTRTWGMFPKGSRCATSDLMAVAGSRHRRAGLKPSCWKAECVERRPLRLEGGKDCKVLPILTIRHRHMWNND